MKHLHLKILLVCFAAASAGGCARNAADKRSFDKEEQSLAGSLTTSDPARIARLKMDAAGQVFLNDAPVTIEELKAALPVYKQKNGIVWYYRENPEQQPILEVTQVNQILVENMLPVKVATKPDFSDAADSGLMSK